MLRPSRAGSVIIYCIALAAIAVIIGYGFLRSTMRDTAAGDSSQKLMLAQSAARAGIADASEAILADYASSSLVVAKGAGTVTLVPPTFLDGPFRAQFSSLTDPNRLYDVDRNSPDGDNDVRAENQVTYPYIMWSTGDEGTRRFAWHDREGLQVYEGRGRYIEPGYRNVTRPAPTGANPQPVVPVKFLDLAAPIPERATPLLLDRHFRRIDSGGTVADDRLAARFRLRYAVGVMDLGGQLLSNPLPNQNVDWKVAANEYRQPPAWMLGAQHAWYNMVSLMPNVGVTVPLRAEHVFLGRGNASNYDRAPATGAPVTFPMMFRIQKPGQTAYWGKYSLTGSSWPPPFVETKGLHQSSTTTATMAGGEPLKDGSTQDLRFISTHFGPQASWYNAMQSIRGSMGGWEGDGGQVMEMETSMMGPTPFGRGVVKSSAGPGLRKWYEGPVDTPWYVNLLTATPRTIHCMVVGYLPPSVKILKYTQENYYDYLGKDVNGNDTWAAAPMNATWQAIPEQNRSVGGRDLFTELSGAGFAEFPAPMDGSGVKPNFLVPDTRSAGQRYPGKLWNGDLSVTGEAIDDMGKLINTNTVLEHGRCSHTQQPFVYDFGGEIVNVRKSGGWKGTPPAGFDHDNDRYVWRLDPSVYKYADSYWWDILKAFSSTVAVARANWVQYPSRAMTPGTAFSPASLRDPSAFNTIEEIDRLFLRQLGENFDTPGDGVPLTPYLQTGDWGYANQKIGLSTTPISNTIRTLVVGDLLQVPTTGVTTQDRSKVMERVLNDFRLSFFGASPQYCDTFRPMDFDGDGKVMCSGYAAKGNVADAEKGIDHWENVVGSGRGPSPTIWFSIAGCFYIGKSHHYRMICRGELFDNLVQRPIADATLETVLVVDPEGNNPKQSHVLFQRWHHNRYTGQMSRHEQ